ncbi:MAG: hypothetical protein WC346_02890 [Methanogenium sp.]|jgi:phosphoribosylcarboxyaminoimidazole (NCAIR) mutase
MKRYIVYNDDEVSSYSDWDAAKKDAKDLDDVNCHFYAVRILSAEEEKEFAWKQFIAGWQQAKLGSVNAESIFKQLWKEQE